LATRSGFSAANYHATRPPIELPIRLARAMPS
jgi:hypothetical protein